MQNPKDLTDAIKHLEQEIQRAMLELKNKEGELKKRELESQQLDQDILRSQKELDLKKHQLYEHSIAIPKLKSEIARLKREQLDKHGEFMRVQKSYQDALRKSDIKLR